ALCLGVALSAAAFSENVSTQDVPKRVQALTKTAQAVADVQEIENLMSRHVFQNRWGLKPGDADFRETVAQKEEGVSYGRDEQYVHGDEARKALRGLDDPAFSRPDALNMDILTTPLIQVAGDGLTARGMWYSIGFLTQVGKDGKSYAAWNFRRVGVDFVKED